LEIRFISFYSFIGPNRNNGHFQKIPFLVSRLVGWQIDFFLSNAFFKKWSELPSFFKRKMRALQEKIQQL
jgi:hypothetical protein